MLSLITAFRALVWWPQTFAVPDFIYFFTSAGIIWFGMIKSYWIDCKVLLFARLKQDSSQDHLKGQCSVWFPNPALSLCHCPRSAVTGVHTKSNVFSPCSTGAASVTYKAFAGEETWVEWKTDVWNFESISVWKWISTVGRARARLLSVTDPILWPFHSRIQGCVFSE